MARTTKGNIYRRGNSKNYYAVYTINGKTTRRLLRNKDGHPTTSKTTAVQLLHDLLNPLALKDKQETVKQIASSISDLSERIEQAEKDKELESALKIADAWEAYENAQNRPDSGERTLKDYKLYFSAFTTWIKKHQRDVKYLRDVTPEIAGRYAASITRTGKSSGTFNKHVGFLKLFFSTLEEPAYIVKNPFAKIKRRKLKTQSRRELTIEELYKILDSATGDFALLLGLGTFTGLRLGDCCTLKWSEVDIIRRVIKRVPNKTANRDSAKPVVIGIPGLLLDRLSEIPDNDRNGYVLPEYAARYQAMGTRSEITRKIQAHFEACGIQCHKDGTGKIIIDGKKIDTGKRAVVEVGFHSLRHTYVSLHAERGTPAAIIQGNVGHGSPAMTAHYTHISDAAAVEVAQVLDFSDKRQEKVVEPERERLRELIDDADIEIVRKVLQILQDSLKSHPQA